jgi:single-stranded-DNA-specific exonuclease
MNHSTIWKISETDPIVVELLQRELNLKPIVAKALAARRIESVADAKQFMYAGLESLHSPWSLPDIELAIHQILVAKDAGDTIFLHGDYDVDGITSTTLFYKFLTKIGCKVIPHVPHRIKEGYGIAVEKIEDAAKMGAKLFLTCDCGGSAFEQIDRANELGMKVVVTDHHHVTQIPNAVAFVNPHREDSQYPFKDICGVGVVFKVCQAIAQRLELPVASFQNAYLDLVALGTIADVMPIIEENRIFVRMGLPLLSKTKKHGLNALYDQSGLKEKASKGLTTYDVGFGIGPRINAAGRIDDAALALELMLAESYENALPIAKQIEQLNIDRRKHSEEVLEQAIQQVLDSNQENDSLVIVSGQGWHPGIVGIVAGRLREKFNRPAFVLTYDEKGQVFHGSGRSIDAFHLAEMIHGHPELVSGGGHAKAAGMTIPLAVFPEAKEILKQYAEQLLTGLDLRPELSITAEADFEEIDLSAAEQLQLLEPYGEGNPKPKFVARNVTVESIKPTKNPDHPQLFIRQDGAKAERFSAFNFGEQSESWNCPFQADIVFEIGASEWNGVRRVVWSLKDVALL